MNTSLKQTGLQGILNLGKPPGCTSRDIVNRIQRIVGRGVKLGHAGTLDPMASGVLLVCLRRATKLIPVIHESCKSYEAGFTLGATSNTDDSTGDVQQHNVIEPPDLDSIRRYLEKQVGTIMQTPPAFSAVKIDGKRAYKAARQGQTVTIQPRPVSIYKIKILDYQFPELKLDIRCGSGTYIRSIARDLGEFLETGALMHRLSRTRIGPFQLAQAIAIDDIELKRNDPASLNDIIHPVEILFQDWPKHQLLDAEIERLRHGHPVQLDSAVDRLAGFTADKQFAAILNRKSGNQFKATINWIPSLFQS